MIIFKSPEEIQRMRKAGRIVALTIERLVESVRPGMTTANLDHMAESIIRKEGAVPSFKGYRGFPGTICTSLNEQIVHGIPGDRRLIPGDVLKLDIKHPKSAFATNRCHDVIRPIGGSLGSHATAGQGQELRTASGSHNSQYSQNPDRELITLRR